METIEALKTLIADEMAKTTDEDFLDFVLNLFIAERVNQLTDIVEVSA